MVLNAYDLRITRHYILFKILDTDDNNVVKFIKRMKSEKEDLMYIETRLLDAS